MHSNWTPRTVVLTMNPKGKKLKMKVIPSPSIPPPLRQVYRYLANYVKDTVLPCYK